MIKEDRVRTECKLAMLEQKNGKEMEDVRGFWEFDYIGKELLISFVTGTICYLMLLLLWVFAQMEELVKQISDIQYGKLGMSIGIWYLVFMAVYFFITLLVYVVRYRARKRMVNQYNANIKRLDRIYAREDKMGQ